MSALGSKLRLASGYMVMFKCPGCKSTHGVSAGSGIPERDWQFNGDGDKPTFSPSVLVSYDGPDAGINGAPPAICHSFVTDGRIQFLADCTHDLAGQTVDLPNWEFPE